MSCSSEEETDVSESELEDYAEQCYEQLKDGNKKVKISDEVYRCPFCHAKKQEYCLKGLYQHASRVIKAAGERRIKEKGKHLGLVRYLDSELVGNDVSGKLHEMVSDRDKNEAFVYPWMGIMANIPVEKRGGLNVGESGSKIRDDLVSKGFNPVRVQPLWNKKGFSGYALIEFNNDWPGFSNAMAFEKSFEAEHHGRWDFFAANPKGDKLYGWVAREDDYHSSGIIGVHLQRKGDLKTVADIEAEEKRKISKLLTSLTNEIEVKNNFLKEIEGKYNETSMSVSSLMKEKDEMVKQYSEEIQKMQNRARCEVEKIFVQHQRIKLQLQKQSKELLQLEKALEKREANNENERQKVDLEKQMNAEATLEQKKAEQKLLELVEEQKREKEELHKKIIDLGKQLDVKQTLELEIQRLRGAEQVMKHIGQDGDEQVKNQLLDIQAELKDKEEDLEHRQQTNQQLIEKENRSFIELQEARKELITGLMEFGSQISLGVKRKGELSEPELWNFKENRKASLKEAIEYMFKMSKQKKRKRT